MSYVQNVRKKIELTVDRLDGGLNQKDGPQAIEDSQSPDCLNITFGDKGSVETREGTSYFNTTAVGSSAADGLGSYKNSTMCAWFGGTMYRSSGTAFVAVSGSTGAFASGAAVNWAVFQNILFCSDGQNGPYRWEGNNSFYKMGMYEGSAPIGASNTAGNIAPGTWYYAYAPVNSHLVEGPLSLISSGVTIAASANIYVSGIGVGTAIAGVANRYVYRASSTAGPWYRVADLGDNISTAFTDSVTVGSASVLAATSTTSPKPFTTIVLHKERFWMDDNDNKSLLRYTDFATPFVSDDLNFQALAEGDDTDIIAIGVQNDLVTAFKDNSLYLADMADASDDTTIAIKKSPSNYGIVSSRSFVQIDNGIIFAAKQFGRMVGFSYLSGLDLVQTQDQFLLSRTLTENIEGLMLRCPTTLYSKIAMISFNNTILVSFPAAANSTTIDGALWFDINRMVKDKDTAPGSWAPWDGFVGCSTFVNHVGNLYGAYKDATGRIIKFYNGTYTDADGSAIDSYWWSKLLGGEAAYESWIKDFRFITPWYDLLAAYSMFMRYRLDGDESVGNSTEIDLTPSGTLWGFSTWGGGVWNAGQLRKEQQYPIGPLLGKRIQVRFDNNNTVGKGFKVHQFKVTYNPRRQR